MARPTKRAASSTSTAHSSLRPCWRKASPGTPESVAYGTPALSREVARLITEELSPSEGIFVTAGHNEGVFAYGESIASTLNLILSLNMTKD